MDSDECITINLLQTFLALSELNFAGVHLKTFKLACIMFIAIALRRAVLNIPVPECSSHIRMVCDSLIPRGSDPWSETSAVETSFYACGPKSMLHILGASR